MKLTDLNPVWLSHGGEGVLSYGKPVPLRERIGISFDCPCGCEHPVSVTFANPVDGLGPIRPEPYPSWTRSGETFEDLTLSPSIQREYPARCWHGFVTDGQITTC
jgi:hypothetical protein